MNESENKNELEILRDKLRDIDDEIFALLFQRMGIVREIGLIKNQLGLPIFDPKREALNIQRNRELADGQLPEAMIDDVTNILAKWAREIQKMAR